MKDNIIVLLAIIVIILSGVFVINAKLNKREIIEPTYSIYTYDYNTTIVYRYMDNKLVYEYSYSGNHLVQIIEGSEQVTIIEFDDRDQAKEFCYSYLDDLRRDRKL